MADGGKSPVTRKDGAGKETEAAVTIMSKDSNKGPLGSKESPRRANDVSTPSLSATSGKAVAGSGRGGSKSAFNAAADARTVTPAKPTDIPLPPIPPPGTGPATLVPSLSNSLPSTPYVHARKLSDEYRTPPAAGRTALDAVTTPRSARSESDGADNVRPSARAASVSASTSRGCRFETGMAFSRRRIPYSLGGDVLEPVLKIKKALDPNEEKRLSGDMRDLYNRLIPTADSEERRGKLVEKLQSILNERWPGQDIKVHVFGSSGNLLCSNDSDVDVCITTTLKSLDRMCNLAKVLADHGMERVVCVPHARVPIVKVWDPELKLSCDMNVNNTLAMVNTRMIRTYVQIDPRVRPLAMAIKHWTRRRILNDAALGGTLSSYTWICMILNFLQTRNPPILPNLQANAAGPRGDSEEPVPSFDDDLSKFLGFGDKNKETVGELVFHFFRRYGHEIDFEKHVISIRAGGLTSKEAKKWHLMQNNRLCVEEPFNTNRNLGNTADDISFRGVHLEIRRAFDLISHAKLEECCEEYIFPPPEEKTWTKPAPQPRPVLTRSLSQQGRGARSTNNGSGGRQANKNRTGPSNRRASSAAAMNKLPPFSVGPASAPLQMPHERLSGSQIHAHLIHHFQLLQAQEQQLRQHLQERAQQAHLSAHAASHLQPIQVPGSAMQQHSTFDGLRAPPNIDPGPLSAPLRGMHSPYYPMHLTPQLQGQRFQQQSVAHNQSSTNPPSPTVSSAQASASSRPHRGLTANEDNSSVRSHSQPPGNSLRGTRLPRHAGVQHPNNMAQNLFLGNNALAQFQQMYMHAKAVADAQSHQQHPQQLHHHRSQTHSPQADSPGLRAMHLEQQVDANGRLLGYCLDPNVQYQMPMGSTELTGVPFTRQAGDGSAHQGRPRGASVSPSITRVRSHTPRSGSPSNSTVTSDPAANYFPAFSLSQSTSHPTSVAGSEAVTSPPPPSKQQPLQKARSGPVIVDGSADADYTPPRETSSWVNGRTIGTSLSSDQAGQPLSFSASPQKSTPPDSTSSPRTPPPHPSTMLQFGDFPARATLRNTSRANRSGSEQSNEAKNLAFPKVSIPERPLTAATGLGIEITGDSSSNSTAKAEGPRHSTHKDTNPTVGLALSSSNPDMDERAPAFLSPVREVRTPSPTVTRAQSHTVRPSSGLSDARYARIGESIGSPTKPRLNNTGNESRLGTAAPLSPVRNGVPQGIASPTSGPTASGPSPNAPRSASFASHGSSPLVLTPVQTGGWQQSVSKKARKNRKASSTSAATLVSEVERKGG